MAFGLGFDQKSSDFKIVRILYAGFFDGIPAEVEVYSPSGERQFVYMTIGVKIERYALDEVSMAFVNGTVNWLPACLCQLFCHLILVPRKIPELLLPSYRPDGHKTQVTVAQLRTRLP